MRIRLSTLYDARGLALYDRRLYPAAAAEFTAAIRYLPQARAAAAARARP